MLTHDAIDAEIVDDSRDEHEKKNDQHSGTYIQQLNRPRNMSRGIVILHTL